MGKKILVGVAVAAVVLLAVTALLVAGFALGRGTRFLASALAYDEDVPQGGGVPRGDRVAPFGGMMQGRGRSDDDGQTFGRRMPGGMMDGWGTGLGQPFGGMMRGPGQNGATTAEPLTVAEAQTAAESFLKNAGLDSLSVAEVMIFDNNGYVEVKDPTTGRGAMELLVDPVSKSAFLEFGPSMMWNTKYGMHGDTPLGMAGRGAMRWMMGDALTAPSGEPSVAADKAVTLAQDYLSKEQPGLTADTTAEAFPGYYTLHVLKDGKVTGMLSVNGYTGQVWYHTWHGTLLDSIEMD
jgi:hypothetical protein